MFKIVPREEVKQADRDYAEIMEKESHHDHKIIEVDNVWRWEENPIVRRLVDKIGLNDLVHLLYSIGCDKNSEVFRKLYRDMGYSLYGYWEVFYWEVNNEDANKYAPIKDPLNMIGSKYRHRNSLEYEVLAVTNTESKKEKYPATVVYKGNNGNVWSRELSDWDRSFTKID